MKKLILFGGILCGLAFSKAHAQTLPQYNMYGQNALLINPAYTGIESYHDLKITGRQQWLNIPEAPLTGAFSFNTHIRPKSQRNKYTLHVSDTALVTSLLENSKPGVHFGLGGYVIYERIGAYDRISANLSYAFHFPLGRKVMASIAPSIGINNTGFDPNKVYLLESNDELYAQYLGSNPGRFTNLDFALGALVYGKNWEIGYSALQLLQNRVYFGSQPTNSRVNIHHNLMGAYTFHFGSKWEMKQSFLVKIPYPNPVSFDVTLKFRYNKVFWFGASYRYENSGAVLLGFTVKKLFSMGYSFDFPYNSLRNNNYGTHEVILSFSINPKKHHTNYLW